jgi:hypothetical protein
MMILAKDTSRYIKLAQMLDSWRQVNKPERANNELDILKSVKERLRDPAARVSHEVES